MKFLLHLTLSIALCLCSAYHVFADNAKKTEDTTETKKDEHLRTSDLPKPVREVGSAFKRVGKELEKGVTKLSEAAHKTAKEMSNDKQEKNKK